MARRKKSGAGGGIGAVVVGLLVLLVASPREHRLLAAVPGLLAERHRQLQRRASADRDTPDLLTQAIPAADAWLQILRKDMQDLLLAELDLRFMPIDGLLAALRTS